jgi:hypothetical protein
MKRFLLVLPTFLIPLIIVCTSMGSGDPVESCCKKDKDFKELPSSTSPDGCWTVVPIYKDCKFVSYEWTQHVKPPVPVPTPAPDTCRYKRSNDSVSFFDRLSSRQYKPEPKPVPKPVPAPTPVPVPVPAPCPEPVVVPVQQVPVYYYVPQQHCGFHPFRSIGRFLFGRCN